jgi:hypothetical protein
MDRQTYRIDKIVLITIPLLSHYTPAVMWLTSTAQGLTCARKACLVFRKTLVTNLHGEEFLLRNWKSKVPRILWNQNVHYCAGKNPSLDPILSQINPLHTFPRYFQKMPLKITLPSIIWSVNWSLR